jgi:hypothetical protein
MSYVPNQEKLTINSSGIIDATNVPPTVPADGSITTAKLAAGAVTTAKLAVANKVKSDFLMGETINGGIGTKTIDLVLTVTGNRPVFLGILSQGTANTNDGTMYNSSSPPRDMLVEFYRNGVRIAYSNFEDAGDGLFAHPTSSHFMFDYPPSGTHTYRAIISTSGDAVGWSCRAAFHCLEF